MASTLRWQRSTTRRPNLALVSEPRIVVKLCPPLLPIKRFLKAVVRIRHPRYQGKGMDRTTLCDLSQRAETRYNLYDAVFRDSRINKIPIAQIVTRDSHGARLPHGDLVQPLADGAQIGRRALQAALLQWRQQHTRTGDCRQHLRIPRVDRAFVQRD